VSGHLVSEQVAKRRCLPALILIALLVLPFASNPSPSQLRDGVAAILAEENLTGAVWATVDADDAIAVDAAGIRDARSGDPLEPDDRVHVGSIAKTLLATGVLRLVSEGRLSLQAPVSDVVPDVVFDNPWAGSDPVRIRHLLDHTSGLDDLHLWQFFSTKPDPDTPLAQAFDGDDLLRVRCRPGTRFSYSNMGYTLLGRIVEAVTGQRYERYLDAHLLRPLGMHDSSFGFVSQQGPHPDPRLAMGHFDDGTAHAAVPVYLRPAGQFTTTARDMGRFARFLMGDGRIDGEVFVDPRWLRAMGEPRGTEAVQAGLRIGYALGLSTRDRHGAVGRCHDGSVLGYRAMLCLFPRQKRAFFWSTNTDSESPEHRRRLDALFVEALAVATPAPNVAAAIDAMPADIDDWSGFYVPAPNRMASFAWLDTVFGFVHLRREGNALRLRSLQSPAIALVPLGAMLFRAPERTIASHVLLMDADGRRVLGTGGQNYAQASTPKLALLWLSLIAGALGLAWLLLSGLARLLARRMAPSHPAFVPVLGVVALLLPLPLFLRQSFLQLGDLTLASGTLAAVTAALPLTMLIGLFLRIRGGQRGPVAMLDVLAMLAVLQWAIVLAAWGLLPLRLWA
jgi:CubicO group peptidase (beta-lactamase class C family)